MGEDAQQTAKARRKDHFWACMLCWLLGVSFLFPWNAILTVGDYYYAVFPAYHPSRVFTLIYQPLSLAATCIFTWYEARCSTRARVLAGYGGFFVFMLLFIIVDLTTSCRGGIGAYAAVCVLIAGLGLLDGTGQGALVGDLSYMDPTYIQAYSGGLAMSGIATSALRMVTKVSFGNANSGLRKGALTFFGVAVFMELVGVVVYALVFPRLRAVKAYRQTAQQQGAYTVTDDLAAAGVAQAHLKDAEVGKPPPSRLSVVQLAVRSWDYLFDQMIIYTLSLCIFPGFLYEDTGHHKLGSWYALVLVGLFNVGDFCGRYLPLWVLVTSRKGLFASCVARLLFVPAFYFAAKYAAAGWMMFLCVMLGATNGYLSVCVFMVAPRGYTSPEQNAIGNLLVLSLIVGLTLGAVTGWLWLIGKGW